MDRISEVMLVNIYVNSKEGDMGEEDGPGKSDMVVTAEMFKELEGNHGYELIRRYYQ